MWKNWKIGKSRAGRTKEARAEGIEERNANANADGSETDWEIGAAKEQAKENPRSCQERVFWGNLNCRGASSIGSVCCVVCGFWRFVLCFVFMWDCVCDSLNDCLSIGRMQCQHQTQNAENILFFLKKKLIYRYFIFLFKITFD